MRTFALPLVALLAVVGFAPAIGAGTVNGNAVGVNAGCADAGLWDVWWWDTSGGSLAIDLTWARLPVAAADYDLQVYRGDALDDGVLTTSEMIASSEHHGAGPAQESISFSALPAGTYVVAVVPYQAEGETYALTAPGSFQYATVGPTPGVELFEPCLI